MPTKGLSPPYYLVGRTIDELVAFAAEQNDRAVDIELERGAPGRYAAIFVAND